MVVVLDRRTMLAQDQHLSHYCHHRSVRDYVDYYLMRDVVLFADCQRIQGCYMCCGLAVFVVILSRQLWMGETMFGSVDETNKIMNPISQIKF